MILRSNIVFLFRQNISWKIRFVLIKDFIGLTSFLSNNSLITKKIIYKIIVRQLIAEAILEKHEVSKEVVNSVIRKLKESSSFRRLEANIDWECVDPSQWVKQANSMFGFSTHPDLFELIKIYFNNEKIRLSKVNEESFVHRWPGDNILCQVNDLTQKDLEKVHLDFLEDCDGIHVRYFKNIYTGYWEHEKLFFRNSDKKEMQKLNYANINEAQVGSS